MTTSLLQLLGNYKIVIPIMQRDYAQGRKSGKVNSIRERFINQLKLAITQGNKPLELDFIYGYTKESLDISNEVKKSFIPLDGQQRLTTLFLLHWLTAIKEDRIDEAKKYLKNFTYETRYSSRLFCNELVDFKPDDLSRAISEIIINEPWFFSVWKSDPTINSMLTMLDALQHEFNDVENMWPLLSQDNPRIVFHLLPMEKLGLPDDLYIKMNSRGKELTEFEHFKSRFSEILKHDEALIFNNKIDQEWSDLFWNLYKDDRSPDIAKFVDNAFLRFFRYVSDLIIANNDLNFDFSDEELINYRKIYQDTDNVTFLFSCLDIFSNLYKMKENFFDSVFYIHESSFEKEKTRLFFQNASTDIFKKCSSNYDSTARINPFSIGEQLLLYACIVHLKNNTGEFYLRIRTLRNLITNSEDTLRKENMPSLLKSVAEIILNNKIDEDTKFNKLQVKEEEEKQVFIEENKTLTKVLFKLEDHQLLQGCIALFKLDEELELYASSFHKVFYTNCNYEEISRALMSFGDYSQKYDWRRRFGNHNDSVWRELFTPSQRRSDFNKTSTVLYALLKEINQSPQLTLDSVISGYLDSFTSKTTKPKEWGFYYIKYPEFRKNQEGYYTWWPKFDGRYECIMMRKTILTGFNWSPFLFAIKNRYKGQLSLGDYNSPLFLIKGHTALKITNLNIGFKVESIDEHGLHPLEVLKQTNLLNEDNIYQISQNQDGLDLEDRVERGVELIAKIEATLN